MIISFRREEVVKSGTKYFRKHIISRWERTYSCTPFRNYKKILWFKGYNISKIVRLNFRGAIGSESCFNQKVQLLFLQLVPIVLDYVFLVVPNLNPLIFLQLLWTSLVLIWPNCTRVPYNAKQSKLLLVHHQQPNQR